MREKIVLSENEQILWVGHPVFGLIFRNKEWALFVNGAWALFISLFVMEEVGKEIFILKNFIFLGPFLFLCFYTGIYYLFLRNVHTIKYF